MYSSRCERGSPRVDPPRVEPQREYPQLCEALGHPEWLQDERFADIRQAMRNRDVLQQMQGELHLRNACASTW